MRKTTFLVLVFAIFYSPMLVQAQNQKKAKKQQLQELTTANQKSLEETGVIKCSTVEYEQWLQAKYPNRATTQEFENWLAPKVAETKALQAQKSQSVIITIPTIFHILTDGAGPENLSQAQIQAQVDQLNIDYANLDNSPYSVAADTELRFCLAQQNEDGNNLSEPGINRVTAYGDTQQSDTTMDGGIKQATQWDPTKYFNVWVADLGGGLLGYAQFPSASGLPGLNASGGAADTDGVVVLYSSVGSEANPNPNGGIYGAGRTLTHEAGHFFGLRHVWGDGGCTVDDYCADTPPAGSANFNCPTGTDSCTGGGVDMIENYMDYTQDTCMNTFTADQATRILAVMTNSPRRMELASSVGCDPGTIYNLDGKIEIEDLGVADCANASFTPVAKITNLGYNTLTSATISYYVDSDTPTTMNWTGSLAINDSESVALNTLSTTTGSHSLTVELLNPNGGTDQSANNNSTSSNYTFNGGVCPSVANTDYLTSTEGVIINDGTTDILSNLNTGKPSGYSDFTSMVTDLHIDESYNFTINVNTDGPYTCYTTVWVDWNQNCTFDANEAYDLGSSYNLVNGPTANSPLAITVPSTAALGNTVMRVTTKYASSGDPCENDEDAEVEDYTINVLPSLGVAEYLLDNIRIYPNPTTGNLTISLSNSNNLPEGYKVYNMLGQIVMQNTIHSISDLSLNTTSLSNGMYFMKITKNGSVTTLPFIKK